MQSEENQQAPHQSPQTYFSADNPVADESFEQQASPAVAPSPLEDVEVVQWQAPEYIHRYKSPVWYGVFVIAVIALVAAALLLMQSITFAVLILVMAFALFVYSARPPHMMNYTLSEKGLYINDTLQGFAECQAVGILRDIDQFSLELVPVRRFRPRVSVYFTEAEGEAIVDILGTRLPMQDIEPDAFDKIVRFLGL